MKRKYNVIGINECNEEFYADVITVQEMDDFTPEELAYMVLEKRRDSYREKYNEEIQVDRFYLERDFSTMSYSELQAYASYYEEY
jgi:endonuclease/exonuclease/phosphatase family metal-dependent hydrolase